MDGFTLGSFRNNKGYNIHCYYWKPQVEPRALLLISHGYTEHCILYEELAKKMANEGFFVFAHDATGHGKSEGSPAFVSNIHDLVEETIIHIQIVRKQYPNLPLFMCGHSMGGALSVLTSFEKESELSGVVLIAPALATNPETATPFKMAMLQLLNKLLPNLPLFATNFSLVTRDAAKIEAMSKDPLRYKGWWKVGPTYSLIVAGQEIQKRLDEVKVPFLVLHGDKDKLCHIDGSSQFHEKAISEDKTFKVYPGGYHSLLNEPDGIASDVIDRTVTWLSSRV